MKIKPLSVLKKARELLSDEKRWYKGSLTNGRTGAQKRWCLLGAISEAAAGDSEANAAAAKRLGITIKEVWGPKAYFTGSVPAFNDADATTHPMILTALDSAIEAERNANMGG